MGTGISTPSQLQLHYNVDSQSINLSSQGLKRVPLELIHKQYPSLRWLNIRDNSITTISSVISKFQFLVNLNVEYNRLEELPAEMKQMTTMKNVNLTGNEFTSVPAAMLEMKQLNELNLCSNKFQRFQLPNEGSDDWCPRKVTISFNRLTIFMIYDFPCLSNLVDLDMSQNMLTCLPENIHVLRNLRRLCCSNNMLTSLPKSMGKMIHLNFVDFECNLLVNVDVLFRIPSLEFIILENNDIEHLPEDVNLPNIREITVFKNKISGLPNNITNLLTLICSENELTSLPADFFSMKELTHLDLSYNKITILDDYELNFFNLQLFSLAHNQIESFATNTFRACRMLKELNLSNNLINSFSCENIPAHAIEYLNLSRNRLTELLHIVNFKTLFNVQLYDNNFTEIPLGICTLPRITSLNISCNEISDFRSIGSMRHIQDLYLGYNSSSIQLPSDMSFMSKLRTLFLAGVSDCTKFPTQMLNLPKLACLYFTNSCLNEIPLSFKPLNSITQLVLSHNKIESFPPLKEFPRLQEVNLSYNFIQNIPDETLIQIGQNCLVLHDFDISYNLLVTVPAEIALIKSIKKLKLQYNRIQTLPNALRKLRKTCCVNVEYNPINLSLLKKSVASMCVVMSKELTNDTLCVGVAEFTGLRQTQEDSIIVMEEFMSDQALYCIFDGHGGSSTAEYLSLNFPTKLRSHLRLGKDSQTALRESFYGSQLFLKKVNSTSGSTAVCVLKHGREITIANAGDARAIVGRRSSTSFSATRLSCDHKPTDRGELNRIRELGGHVVEGRVNQSLAVARALGDLDCQPYVSYEPFVDSYTLKDGDDFVIIGCDGVWDVLSDDEAVELVYNEFQRQKQLGQDPYRICGGCAVRLRDEAFLRESADNISCIVVPT